MFQPAICLPGPDRPVEVARAEAERLISTRLISHIHIMDGEDAADIAAWIVQLQEMAASTRLEIPISFSTDPRSGFYSSPFTGKSAHALSRWPEHTGIGATRDTELVREYAEIIRREMVAMGIRVYLGPMADVYTEPRWSRGFGTFGEDAELVSAMTAAFIEGLRGGPEFSNQSVSAVVKHFPGAGPQLRGLDAHDKRHREQVYPGGQRELHLRPFEAAFAAGVTQVMPYYGMPVGTDWQERGFAFNEPVIQGLLRGRFGFDGVVCTDWYLLESTEVDGIPFGPNGYGLEELTPTERLKVALDAGVDQFGGDECTERVIELVRSGEVVEARIDESVRRILLEKFRLGLFEDHAPDPELARAVATDPDNHRAGRRAQAAALTLLKNEGLLPLAPGTRVYAEGVGAGSWPAGLTPVGDPGEADVILIRQGAPWESDPDSALGDFFHAGRLDYPQATVDHVRELAAQAPVVIVTYLERPAILTDLELHADALVGDFGASDRVVLEALTGASAFTGRLPFDLPRSMQSVEKSREDVPFDTSGPLYGYGAGIQLETSEGALAP